MSEPLLPKARELSQAREYAAVVELLGPLPRAELLELPEQAYLLADAERRVGGSDDLLDLISATVQAAREQQDVRVLCDALNLQGVVLLEHGNAQAAERAWFDLVIVATEADNPLHVARASNNLGIAATLSMRLEPAIAGFQRAIGAYLRLGYTRGLAQSHHNLGIVYRELDHAQKAHDHFHRAITFARTGDLLDDVARAEEEMALLILYTDRETRAASELAHEALEKFAQLKQPAGTGGTLRVLGLIALADRKLDEADDALQSAYRIGRDRSLRLLEAETLLALAALARCREQQSKEYDFQHQARRIFAEMGAGPWGEQVRKRMVQLTDHV